MAAGGQAINCFVLFCLAVACQGASGLPLLFARSSAAAQRFSVLLMLTGSCAGSAAALWSLTSPAPVTFALISGLPFGPGSLGIDALSAWFLIPVFLVTGASALFALGYWPADRHPETAARVTFFLGLLAASLSALLLVRHLVLFLVVWEIMALAAWFALSTEDEKPEVRDAGILYLVTAHLGVLVLFAMVSLIASLTGSYLFPAPGSLPAQGGLASAIFLCALIGFGLKAGVMPLHVWLPSAHANAPSHISAVLSGVVLKVGIYGMVRIFSCFATPPPWWGGTVLILGAISGVIGVAFAIGQHDLKRLLAYHSIENIGIIMIGLGCALLGQSLASPVLATLGLAGALLHVLNHATFKALLFLGAGAVIQAAGTREIEVLGGVGRRLPRTGLFFLTGALAICGLPPLNGFVSELMIYLAGFTSLKSSPGLMGALPVLAVPVLALIGGLAVACFVKVYGVVFLGEPRSPEHVGTGDPPASMLGAQALLALVCVLIGVAPICVARPLENALAAYRGGFVQQALVPMVPFTWITLLAVLLLMLAAGAALWLRRRTGRAAATSRTWGCGYLKPTPRMQYSASSFGSLLVAWFGVVLRPEVHRTDPAGSFPGPAAYRSHLPETALERLFLPLLEYLYEKSAPVRHLQHGKLNLYIVYTFLTLVVLFILTTR
ncbi:hydrogenase [Geomonas silvestris]|uniref:Hydrogenase n=1 Tax=Geomonas silvestris TaxID=2740184 RepID=A0A6V8MJN7_9BACT|nr:proton-conducting transporter membrane subunit [Geomonas silvestris]GFO60154.1 hydrogenase [Geomonas silvestris]